MTGKKTRKKSEGDPDPPACRLLSQNEVKIEGKSETDRLREEILSDAKVVARWKTRSFYIS